MKHFCAILDLNEVVVAQHARALPSPSLGGPEHAPPKILDFWTLQSAILGILANFSNIIECYFARSLGERSRIVHTPTKCIGCPLIAVSVQGF